MSTDTTLARETTYLIDRLQDEADLCRNDGAEDTAELLDEAITALRSTAAGSVDEWRVEQNAYGASFLYAGSRFLCGGTEPVCMTKEDMELIARTMNARALASTKAGTEGWRPIETAPKDGTEVIIEEASGNIYRAWFFAPSSRTQEWRTFAGNKCRPVRWVPLPAPPAPAQGEE